MTMEYVDTLADENEGVLVELRFLDARRWVMRGVRVKNEKAEQAGGLSLQRAWDEGKESDAAEPGTEHHRGGSYGNLLLWKSGNQDRPISQIWEMGDRETKNVGKKRGEFGYDILGWTIHGRLALTTSTPSSLVPTRKKVEP